MSGPAGFMLSQQVVSGTVTEDMSGICSFKETARARVEERAVRDAAAASLLSGQVLTAAVVSISPGRYVLKGEPWALARSWWRWNGISEAESMSSEVNYSKLSLQFESSKQRTSAAELSISEQNVMDLFLPENFNQQFLYKTVTPGLNDRITVPPFSDCLVQGKDVTRAEALAQSQSLNQPVVSGAEANHGALVMPDISGTAPGKTHDCLGQAVILSAETSDSEWTAEVDLPLFQVRKTMRNEARITVPAEEKPAVLFLEPVSTVLVPEIKQHQKPPAEAATAAAAAAVVAAAAAAGNSPAALFSMAGGCPTASQVAAVKRAQKTSSASDMESSGDKSATAEMAVKSAGTNQPTPEVAGEASAVFSLVPDSADTADTADHVLADAPFSGQQLPPRPAFSVLYHYTNPLRHILENLNQV